jgi:hypothetical protein
VTDYQRDGTAVAVALTEASGEKLAQGAGTAVAVALTEASGEKLAQGAGTAVAVALTEASGGYNQYQVPYTPPNIIENPCAAIDLTGWDTLVPDNPISQVFSVPYASFPDGISTAIRGGRYGVMEEKWLITLPIDLEEPLVEGDVVAWSILAASGIQYTAQPAFIFIMFFNESETRIDRLVGNCSMSVGWNQNSGLYAVPESVVLNLGSITKIGLALFSTASSYLYATLAELNVGSDFELIEESSWVVNNFVLSLNRPNFLPNPRAADDTVGWTGYDVPERVLTAPMSIPGPGTTALKTVTINTDQLILETDYFTVPLPPSVGPEDWVALQFECLVAGGTDEEGFLWCEPGFCDSTMSGGDYPDLINDINITLPEEVTDFLPLTDWQRYAFNVQLGADEGWEGPPKYLDLEIGINYFVAETPFELYVTNVLVEKSTGADFVIEPYQDQTDITTSWNDYQLVTGAVSTRTQISNIVQRTYSTIWSILGTVELAAETVYTITSALVVAVTAVSSWILNTLIRGTTSTSYAIDRRVADVRTMCWLNTFNCNDGINTFVRSPIKLPTKSYEYDEVRSGLTGDIRQVNVHQPLVTATIPMMIQGTSASDLKARIAALTDEVVSGGELIFQEGADDGGQLPAIQTYTIGVSKAPEIAEDHAYRHHNMAIFELQLVAMAQV